MRSEETLRRRNRAQASQTDRTSLSNQRQIIPQRRRLPTQYHLQDCQEDLGS